MTIFCREANRDEMEEFYYHNRKIVLIRHVTPLIDTNQICDCYQAQQQLEYYDKTTKLLFNEISNFQRMPEYQQILSIKNIFISPAIRAKQTAWELFKSKQVHEKQALKEFNLAIIPIPLLKMKASYWFILSRLLWLLGIHNGQRSLKQEKARVNTLLTKLTQDDCIIVSHAFVLREIKKSINRLHFVPIFKYKNGCFSVEIFEKDI